MSARGAEGFDRPRFLWVAVGAALLLMFVPLAVVILFSLNSTSSLASQPVTPVPTLPVLSGPGVALGNHTLALAMIGFCIPFVTVVVRARLASINPEIEQSALDLGATPIGALRLVVLPLLWPSIAAASMLCFVLSFDDFVTAAFTAGIGTPPLPLRIYSMLRFGVTPVVNAIGVIMMLIALTAVRVALSMLRVARRRTSEQGRRLEAADNE
jgi:ABC-type spermidine/putrescine transport system permease subunit II